MRKAIKAILIILLCITVFAFCTKIVPFNIKLDEGNFQKITGSPSYIKIKEYVMKGSETIKAHNPFDDWKKTGTGDKYFRFTLFQKQYTVTFSSKLAENKKITSTSTTKSSNNQNRRQTSKTTEDKSLKEYANKILKKIIKKDMSDIEKVKAVHDYIITHTEYDYENLKNNSIPESCYEAEGVLYDGKAVCQGYAYAFQLFMKLLDIDSKIVTGVDLRSGDGHAWNMVSIDGDWYQVDTTWDDPVPDQKGKVQYRYFLITDEILSDNHDWNKKDYPSCNSEKYLYYVYQKNIIQSISQYEKAFIKRYKAGERTITLLYPEQKTPELNFLLKYDDIREKKGNKYTVSYQTSEPWRLGDYTVFTVILK